MTFLGLGSRSSDNQNVVRVGMAHEGPICAARNYSFVVAIS